MRLVRVICPRKSAGAMRLTRALRERLPNRVLRTKDLTRVRRNDIIVNWGCSEFPWPNGAAINAINHPWAVYNCVNKVRTYEVLSRAGLDRYLPMHTTDMYDAQRMLDEGTVICVRHLTEAHGGRGIEIVSEGQLPVAPLYTEYVPKKDEYRVHVDPWGVWVQKKMGRTGADRNYQVRNHENGWVYAVNHERASDAPEPVLEAGEAAVRAMHLDFGAADIGWTRRSERATIYEINTAPGLEGDTTLRNYADSIATIIREGEYNG